MTNPQIDRTNLDLHQRTQLTLWAALLLSIILYFLMTFFIIPPAGPENRPLTIVFSVLSAFLVVVSFAVKSKFLARSVEAQDIRMVRTGSILTWAICEAGGLLGLVGFLVAHDRYYFVPMAFAFLGILLHFPRRSQLEAASYKQTAANLWEPGN